MDSLRTNHFIQRYKALFLLLLIVVLSNRPQVVSAQGKFRIISYNILEGMKLDTTAGKVEFVNWVKSQNPDILALEECNKFTQTSLEEMAHKYGHPYAVLLRETGYPVGITSKYPIVDVHRVTDNMQHGFIVAKIKNYNVIVLHFAPHKYKKRREEVEVILSTIAASPSQNKWIIMGDFNSFSPLDKDNYADGKTVKQLQEAAKKYSFHENLVDGQYLDFDVQQKILDFGLKDTGKMMATKDEPKSNRIDYIYVSKDLISQVTSAHFIRDSFTANHSDHKPVIMEIKN